MRLIGQTGCSCLWLLLGRASFRCPLSSLGFGLQLEAGRLISTPASMVLCFDFRWEFVPAAVPTLKSHCLKPVSPDFESSYCRGLWELSHSASQSHYGTRFASFCYHEFKSHCDTRVSMVSPLEAVNPELIKFSSLAHPWLSAHLILGKRKTKTR